jgi:hypothetical protein
MIDKPEHETAQSAYVKTAKSSKKQSLRKTPTPRRESFANVPAIRREMAALYREAKAGKLDVTNASKLVHILTQIRTCLESEQLREPPRAMDVGPDWTALVRKQPVMN